MVEEYAYGAPNDWLERHVFTAHRNLGIALMLATDVVLFGVLGLTVWAIQMLWIPFFAAGVINGLGHFWGYRNFEVEDASTNIVPWGIVIGGEELHNNHHAFASSARFSQHWWELDLGWFYIRILEIFGLAKVRRIAMAPRTIRQKTIADVETARAIIVHRMHVMADFARQVVQRVHRDELRAASTDMRSVLRPVRRWLAREPLLDDATRQRLVFALKHSDALTVVHQFKHRLQALWRERTTSPESTVLAVQEWCRQAEETGISALAEFANRLRGYSLQSAG